MQIRIFCKYNEPKIKNQVFCFFSDFIKQKVTSACMVILFCRSCQNPFLISPLLSIFITLENMRDNTPKAGPGVSPGKAPTQSAQARTIQLIRAYNEKKREEQELLKGIEEKSRLLNMIVSGELLGIKKP